MRKFVFYCLAVTILACSTITNLAAKPTETLMPTVAFSPMDAVAPTIADTPSLEPTWTPATGFTMVRVHPSDGDLNEQLAVEVLKAAELARQAYVEFDATWCPCCQAIKTSLEDGNSLMVDAFQGVYLIRADVDEWRDYLEGTGFVFDAIPIFYRLDDQGYPTGASIDGGAWGENIPENMAPPLKEFFQNNGSERYIRHILERSIDHGPSVK